MVSKLKLLFITLLCIIPFCVVSADEVAPSLPASGILNESTILPDEEVGKLEAIYKEKEISEKYFVFTDSSNVEELRARGEFLSSNWGVDELYLISLKTNQVMHYKTKLSWFGLGDIVDDSSVTSFSSKSELFDYYVNDLMFISQSVDGIDPYFKLLFTFVFGLILSTVVVCSIVIKIRNYTY